MNSHNPFRRRIKLNLLAILSATTLAFPVGVEAEELPSSRDLEKRIDAIAQEALVRGPYPGLAIAVEKKGQIIFEKGYGDADLENRVPVTPATVFAVGSITKPFTCLSLLQLAETGKISIDETVGTYLPDLPKPARDLKIRYLLTHTSGLVNYTDQPDFPYNERREFSREQTLTFFAERPLLFTPGTRWSYSNSNTYLAGLIVEKLTGLPYGEYVQQNVLKPFGMASTRYADWTTLISHRARGYRRSSAGWQNALQFDPNVPFSAGALLSTAGDLVKFPRMVFGSEQVSRSLQELVLSKSRFENGEPVAYTNGCLVTSTFEGRPTIGHSGDIYGFSGQLTFYPQDGLTIAVTTNQQRGSWPPLTIERKVARAVLGLKEASVVDLVVPEALGEALAGDYRFAPYSFGPPKSGFSFKDGKLLLHLGGVDTPPTMPLRYQGKNLFVSPVDDEHRFRFTRGVGKRPSQVEMEYYGGFFRGRRL